MASITCPPKWEKSPHRQGGGGLINLGRAAIRRSLDESSDRLGVTYFDIVHLHDVEYEDRKHTEWALSQGMETLEELKKEGRIGFIGIGMYPPTSGNALSTRAGLMWDSRTISTASTIRD